VSAAAFRAEDIEISEEDLAATPPAVRKLLSLLLGEVTRLRKRCEELKGEAAALRHRVEQVEAKLGENSSNSNKPPSSDSPYKEKRPSALLSLRFRVERIATDSFSHLI
jgi:hypothetical protein